MASKERNALAELAHTLCGVVVDDRYYATVGEYWNAEDALKKSIRIIAELAKVEWRNMSGQYLPVINNEFVESLIRCRAIAAEEGVKE